MAENGDLKDRVYETLRQAILATELKPRERLVETTLAGMLEVSRTPVREALRKLELEGLVEHSPLAGTVVADIRLEDVIDVYTMRAYLEGCAARSALPNFKPEHFTRLEFLLEQTQAAAEGQQWQALLELNATFHYAICEPCQRILLLKMIRNLADQCLRFRSMVLSKEGTDPANYYKDHVAIYQTIRRGDPDAVELCVRNHLMVGPTRVSRSLATVGDRQPAIRSLRS